MIHTTTFDLRGMFAGEIADALTQEVLGEIAAEIANMARDKWITLAQERLTGTRADYLAGIQEVKLDGNEASVVLVGTLPNAIENDQASYDMHDTLLGPNVPVVERGGGRGKHQKKDGGYYRAIPFRHATPGGGGINGTPMGHAHAAMLGKVEAARIGKEVHKAAKALHPTTGDAYKLGAGKKASTGGIKLKKLAGAKWGGRLRAGMAPKLKPHHATDIYAGMVRLQKTYEKATQNSYMTFRTISTGSPGWMRKATKGANLLAEVSEFASAEGGEIVKGFLDGLGGGDPQ